MAVPDKLYTPTGAVYEVLNADPPNSATAVSFKYKFTETGETIPGWFDAGDTGESGGGTFTLSSDQTTITINNGGSHVKWVKWGSGSGDKDLLNRAAIHNAMATGMFTELSVSADHTIRADYTYKLIRVDASSSNVTITLPEPGCPQTTIRLVATCGTSTRVTIAPPTSFLLNGTSSNIQLPLDWDSDTPILITQDKESGNLGWRTQIPVAGDLNDPAPIAAIRRMTQTAYDALASTDPNTLYVIE